MREFIIAANWKMYKTFKECDEFVSLFLKKVEKKESRTLIIFPQTILLPQLAKKLSHSFIKWGAQNCYFEPKGAFTGETSPEVLADLGTSYVLVGHSERRQYFCEKDELLSKKVKTIQSFHMIPLLCVGESLQERESGKTNHVILSQLINGLKLADHSKPFALAYEPVWAIGTGKVATPEQAEEAHQILRNGLREIGPHTKADQISILYGGSVKPENAKELGKQKNIDGFLVGGASLEPDSFASIAAF